MPVGVRRVVGAADADHIHPETVEHAILRLGDLLDNFVNAQRALKAQTTAEVSVGKRGDTRARGRAQVDGDPVRFFVPQGSL